MYGNNTICLSLELNEIIREISHCRGMNPLAYISLSYLLGNSPINAFKFAI